MVRPVFLKPEDSGKEWNMGHQLGHSFGAAVILSAEELSYQEVKGISYGS